MDDRGGRVDELADRTTGFTGQWAALGPSELYWALLGCSGQCWSVLDCNGLHWAVLGCPGL